MDIKKRIGYTALILAIGLGIGTAVVACDDKKTDKATTTKDEKNTTERNEDPNAKEVTPKDAKGKNGKGLEAFKNEVEKHGTKTGKDATFKDLSDTLK